MADTPDNSWVPVDGGAKDAQGNYMALQGGQWKPAKGVAKDASGKYVAHFGATAAPSNGGGADVPNMDSDVAAFKKGNKEYHDKLDSESTLTKIKGAADAVGSTVWNMGAGVVGDIAGAAKGLTSKKYGTQAGVQEAMDRADEVTRKLGVMPGSEAGKVYSEAIGKVLSASGLEGAMGAEAGVASRVGGKVATEAAEGAKASLSAAAQKAATLSKIDPVVLKQAQLAHELGIDVNIHQLYQNRLGRMIGETLEEVPLGGSQAKNRQTAFDRVLVKQLGGEGDRLTKENFGAAMDKQGGRIGESYKGRTFPLDEDFSKAMDQQLAEVARAGNQAASSGIPGQVAHIRETARANGGVIPGATLKELDSELGKLARGASSDPTFAEHLYKLQSTLRNQLAKVVTDPKEIEELKDARMKYAKGKTLEPLVAKSPDGHISPALLTGRVNKGAGQALNAKGKAGTMGDLGDIGQLFLKAERDSGTAPRSMAQKMVYGATRAGQAGAAGGVAAHLGVAAIVPALTGAMGAVAMSRMYNKLGPKLAQKLLAKEQARQAAQTAAEMARKVRLEKKLKAMAEDAS